MSEDNLIIDTEVIEVEGAELYTIDSYNAFSALGEPNEQLRHQLLNGRDMSDQHPITAITGLRNELDSIEALQTIYSDKKQMADYYKWQDGNKLQQDRVGYFVSLCSEDVGNIKICTGDNIFGVVIDNAAFIGGQDDIARDITYGLVLYAGVAHIRCESDVSVGDCVISNAYGMARKSNNDYGCKVIAISEKLGVKYAVVTLNLSVDQIDLMGENLKDFSERMDSAEKNIITAMNTANDAYNKAVSGGGGSGNVSEEVINNIMSSIQGDLDNLNQSVSNANTAAGEAQAIANAAIANVEVVRVEAIEKANQVLSDVSGAIADLDVTTQEIRDSVSDVDTKAQLAVDDLIELKEEMAPLSEWTGENGAHSFAGFVAKAKSDSAYLADLAMWKGTVDNGSVESIAGLERRVSDNETVLNLVADYTKENEDGTTTDGFAGLIAQVDENGSELSTLASYEYTDENGEVISSGLSGLIQQVEANASTIKMLAGFEDDDVDSLGEIAITVNANKSAINSLVSWKDDASQSIASTEELATKNKASINQLTGVDSELRTNMTAIQQQSDENGASIQLLAANIDKYSVGEYSQSYGLTQSQAKNILKDGIVYVPTTDHSETFSDVNKDNVFSRTSYYVWNSGEWVQYDNAVVFYKTVVPSHNNTLKYWYVDSNNALDGYEPHALYMSTTLTDDGEKEWFKVSTSDSTNRAISMIRQTQNEIALEVTNARGDFAGLNARLENDKEAYTQMVASVVKPDGTVDAASIIAAVNNGDTSIALNADHIVLNGYTSNANGSFQIDTDGYLVAQGGGRIADWSISDNALKKVVSRDGNTWNYYIQTPNSDTSNIIAVRYGEGENPSTWTYPFKVNAKGELTATKANITGGSIKIGDDFEVTSTGKVYARNAILKGSLYLYDELNKENVKVMHADGTHTYLPQSCVFENLTWFEADAMFHYDIEFATDPSNPGTGACMYSEYPIYISTKGTGIHTTDHNLTVRLSNTDDGRFQPCINNKMDLGSSSLKWKEVYAGTGTINTSDRNEKDNIKSITDIHEQLFMKLLPVSYTFKDGTSGRTHIGFISQDVESAMEELGLTSLDFAGFCKDIKMKDSADGNAETEPDLDEDGNVQYLYSLRYSEFIALNTHMIQKLSQRTSDLEERVAQLEELIKEK